MTTNDSLEIELDEGEIKRVIEVIKDIVNNGVFSNDWTYSVNNQKNIDFLKTYICGEEKYREVLNKLDLNNFYEAEKNNSPRAKVDSKVAKEIMYKFILEESFVLRIQDERDDERINIYVKITFPYGLEDSLIIVSFHQSLRSLKEELEKKNERKN